jgi:hypothetical protein
VSSRIKVVSTIRLARAAVALLACLALLVAASVAGWPAATADGFVTGIDDPNLQSSDAGERDRWFDRTVDLGARVVRLDVVWDGLVAGKPANPNDPSDPAYDFSGLDAAVQAAGDRNLNVMLTFQSAPSYAEGANGPGAYTGGWKVEPAALGSFAQAVASRYSGSFGGLPRVSFYEAWNEPNLDAFLGPQYAHGRQVAVGRYRKMLNAVEKSVTSVRGDNEVIAGSLAPYGDDPGDHRTRPLIFLRKLFCLNHNLKKTSCPSKARFDILSHHPINLSGPPRQSAISPDDVGSADMKNVEKTLRAAEREKTIGGGSKHPLWVTEYWWESFPDGFRDGIAGLKDHGLWIEEALYLFWKAGVDTAVYYTLQDSPFDPDDPGATLQAGLFNVDGDPKPAAQGFTFPFVTERSSKRKVKAWGKAPASGKLKIERKSGNGWSKIDSVNVKAGKVFTANLSFKGKEKLRATVAGQESLTWPQGAKVDKIYEVDSKRVSRQASGPAALRESVPPTR